MKHGYWILAVLLGTLLTACGPKENEPVMGKITGTLTYRERMMLTPEASVTVTLQDVSLADAPAKTIAELTLDNPGQVPIPFELEYDPEVIDERMSYSMHAQISDSDGLMFVNDTHTPVLTRGGGNEVEIKLIRIRRPTVSPTADTGAITRRPRGTQMAGMFTYMADAAIFEDCRNRKVYPVSMEGAYLELERAYSNSGIMGGDPLLVQIEGRLLERPAMEGNLNEVKLIVDSFTAIHPEQSCVPPVDEELQNTYWKLLEVAGETVKTPEGQKEAHMILAPADSRVHGNAGCNNFFGSYEVDGESLSFGDTGATMMACLDGMETEQAFLAALGATDRYSISGLMLELYKGEELLAKFEAVHLP